MTRSGRVSGNVNVLEDNLLPGFETKFSRYLARVTAELERRHGVRFRTLSPVNEPNTPYWFSTNTQEGAHWSPEAQSRIFIALAQVLNEYGMRTEIAGPDETNPQTFFVVCSCQNTSSVLPCGFCSFPLREKSRINTRLQQLPLTVPDRTLLPVSAASHPQPGRALLKNRRSNVCDFAFRSGRLRVKVCHKETEQAVVHAHGAGMR